SGGVALIGLIILLVVVKPMIRGFLDSAKDMAANSIVPALAPPSGGALPPPTGTAVAPANSGEMIDIGQVEGRVAASSMKKIGEIVEKHPDEAVAIVRSW